MEGHPFRDQVFALKTDAIDFLEQLLLNNNIFNARGCLGTLSSLNTDTSAYVERIACKAIIDHIIPNVDNVHQKLLAIAAKPSSKLLIENEAFSRDLVPTDVVDSISNKR
ncbi:hypothetical protein Hypma_010654 [Hypsizygus marmoreus]|uniref:Uncharacterized protein n=1 Tax=Hypsizygus marmoreus TaxID=39966 RepID=A0A369JR39_HYPMA|nr:hypothetical protein Hypma_010654 [Hypsizygus marmoreus]